MKMASIRSLPKELQKIAIEKLKENPDTIHDSLNEIREWAESQKHLKVRTDDQWLLTLLRGCRFNFDKAKQKIETLCTAKSTLSFLEDRDPFSPEIQELLSLGLILPLKKSDDPAAPSVTLLHLNNADATKIPPEAGIKYASMIMDIVMNEDDNSVIVGGILIADSKGVAAHHTLLVSPTLIGTAYEFFRDAYALRAKGAYAINTPGFIEVIYNTFKSVLPTFLQNMVHIYSDSRPKELYEAIPLSILPEEYGGTGGTIEELTAYWKEKVESYNEWFLKDAEYCLDESQLPQQEESSWFGVNWLMEKLSFE